MVEVFYIRIDTSFTVKLGQSEFIAAAGKQAATIHKENKRQSSGLLFKPTVGEKSGIQNFGFFGEPSL